MMPGGHFIRRVAGGAWILLVAFARAAHAQDAPEPFSVDYRAPDGCPDASAFLGEVTARTPRARAAATGERARVLHVRVEKRGDTLAGRLWIEDAGAASTAREVSGGSCGEVVGALGLVAALAVDPRASVAPRPAPAAASASPSPPAPATAPAPPTTDPPPPTPPAEERPTTSAPREADEASRSPSPPQARDPRRWTVGAGGEVSALSDAVVSLRLFGELDFGGGLVAPALRIAAGRSLPVDRVAPIGRAALTWTDGALEVSPLRFALARSVLTLRPCAAVAAGILEAEGAGVATPRAETRAWVAASVHGRLAWTPISALVLELEGGAHLPLLREKFFFDPNVPIYQAPAIAGFGRFSAGVRFP
ncbi:MAG: hypothetical protein JST00_36030 [Deltaproteobacteria bacterium]|nr:hypothetical protein [Deltaproteobacteria bacterium]